MPVLSSFLIGFCFLVCNLNISFLILLMPYIPDLKDILIFSLISLGTFTIYKVNQLHKCELNIVKIDKDAIQHDLALQKDITKESSITNNEINTIQKEYLQKSTSKIKDKKFEELIAIYNNL